MFQPFLSLAHVLKFQQFPHWLKAVLLSARACQSAENSLHAVLVGHELLKTSQRRL